MRALLRSGLMTSCLALIAPLASAQANTDHSHTTNLLAMAGLLLAGICLESLATRKPAAAAVQQQHDTSKPVSFGLMTWL